MAIWHALANSEILATKVKKSGYKSHLIKKNNQWIVTIYNERKMRWKSYHGAYKYVWSGNLGQHNFINDNNL